MTFYPAHKKTTTVGILTALTLIAQVDLKFYLVGCNIL